MDRREYMREYKRRYRAAHNVNKHDGDGFLSLSCLSVEKADILGRGEINGFALVFDGNGAELQGDNITGLLDAFKSVKAQNTVYVCNLKVWGRFFVAEAERLKMTVSDDTRKKNTYRVVVNSVGDWLGVELNIDGNRTFLKSFSEIIRTPLDKAYQDFCGGLLRNAGVLRTARAMRDIMDAFKKALLKLSGGVSFKANTISGYAQKLCEIIAGHGCPEYGKAAFKAVFPTLSREFGDELRAAKVYRGGWNYISPQALNYTGAGYVLDVRSFYPSIYAALMPFGHFIKVKGGDVMGKRAGYSYSIYNVLELGAHLKPDGVPTIQIINDDDTQTKYLTEINYTGGAAFMLDDFDLSSLYTNYDVDFITIDYAYKFRTSQVEFLNTYAIRLFTLKTRCNSDAVGAAAKYLLNSLSGRFGRNSYRREVDVVKNKSYKGEYKYIGELGYLPAAVYINSRGRWYISELARLHKDVFLYSDTDSIIIKGDEIPKDLQMLIGDGLGELGVKRFCSCKFFGQKCYGVEMVDGWQWTVAGASPQMLKELDAGAYSGQILRGGVAPKIYDDGTIAFKEREFTLARNMIF